MHASLAYVNGAGNSEEDLRLLNTLLSTGTLLSSGGSQRPRSGSDKGKSVGRGKSKDQRQAEEESRAVPISKPGGFKNDPPDPTNPNEVRERHLRKINR